MASVWDFTESAPEWVSPLVSLWSWGLNCEPASNPWLFFLDLVGWSAENYGEAVTPAGGSLGWRELDYLADALKVYADRPRDCDDWLSDLMTCDE